MIAKRDFLEMKVLQLWNGLTVPLMDEGKIAMASRS